jgi:hypothetical protein
MNDDIPIKPVDGSDIPKDAPSIVRDGFIQPSFMITVSNGENNNTWKTYLAFFVILAITFLVGMMSQALWHVI